MGKIYEGYLPAADLLRDRVVLVTGAGGGIGGAIALACARHGAQAILHDRTVKPVEKSPRLSVKN